MDTMTTTITIDWPAITATPGVFRIALRSYPNPDFREIRPRKPPTNAQGSLLEVINAAHAYRTGLGGGNWGEPTIERQDGEKWVAFARVSYNGRIWPPEPWHSGTRAIFEKADDLRTTHGKNGVPELAAIGTK
jgi:hypothetical protein